MPTVFARLSRAVACLTLAPWVAFSPAFAPEHLHEADDDHAHAIAHQHFDSHDPLDHGSTVDHHEGRVIWFDQFTAVQTTHAFPLLQAVLTRTFDGVAIIETWVVTSHEDAAPPHGPPRSTLSLRAPPLLPA